MEIFSITKIRDKYGRDGFNLKLTRGDYASFSIAMNDGAGNPYTLQDGDALYFTVKKNTKTEDVVFQKVFEYGDIPTVEIEHDDTEGEKYGTYQYDVCLVKPGERPDTFIGPCDFIITEEVTF